MIQSKVPYQARLTGSFHRKIGYPMFIEMLFSGSSSETTTQQCNPSLNSPNLFGIPR